MQLAASYVLLLLLFFVAYRARKNGGYALGLMWAMYAIEQSVQQANPIFVQRSSLLNVLLTSVALGAIGLAVLRGEYDRYRISSAQWTAWGLIIWAVMSYIWTISRGDTIGQLKANAPYVVAFIFITPLLAHRKRAIEAAIETTIYVGGFILLICLFLEVGSRGIVLDQIGSRKVEANPLALASYAGVVGICSVFSIYAVESRKIWKIIKFAILLLAVWTIVRSGSRGQMVALLLACFVWLPITASVAAKRNTVVPLLIMAMAAMLAVYAISQSEIATRWNWEAIVSARQGRSMMLLSLLEKWHEGGLLRWVFGLGSSASFRYFGTYPHIVPGEILAELGVVGFGLFGTFVMRVSRDSWNVLKSQQLSKRERVSIGTLVCIFTFFGLLTLKQGSLLGSSSFLCAGITLSIAVRTCVSEFVKTRPPFSISVPVHRLSISDTAARGMRTEPRPSKP